MKTIQCILLLLVIGIIPSSSLHAQKTAEQVRELKRKIRTSKTTFELVTNMMHLATDYVNTYKPDSAILLLLRSKSYLQTDSTVRVKYRGWIYTDLARAYMLKKEDQLLNQTILDYFSGTRSDKELRSGYYTIGYYYKRWYADHMIGVQHAIPYLDSAENLSRTMKGYDWQIVIKLEKIECYQILGKLDSAEVLVDKLQVFERQFYDSLSGRSYFQKHFNNLVKGQYNSALENLLIALDRTEKYGDDFYTSDIYMFLAMIYHELGKNEESILWHKKTLSLVEGDIMKGGSILTNQQSMYFLECCALVKLWLQLGRISEARTLINETLQKYPPSSDVQKARSAQMLAYLYDAINNKVLAYKNYITMAEYYDKVHRMELPGAFESAMNDVSAYLVKEGKFDEAKVYIVKAVAGRFTRPLPLHVSESYRLLYKVDSAQGNYLASIEHLSKHKRIQDSVFTERKGYQMEELQVKYAMKQKEKDILLLRKQDQIAKAELAQASLMQRVTMAGIGVLVILLLLSYNQFRIKRKSNRQLQLQRKEISDQNISLKHLVDEKEWLLKEIHHRVKNNLHMITSLLSSQAFNLNDDIAKLAVKDSQNRIQAMSMVHQKLYINENISNIDASIYICDLVDHLRSSFSVDHIRFTTEVEPIRLAAHYAIPIGLIVNEAITNSIKYAFPSGQAGVISISLSKKGKEVLLSITDNGVGFPPHQRPGSSKSLGMTLIHGLAQELDAAIDIKSSNGTSISLVIPFDSVALGTDTVNGTTHTKYI